MKELEDPELELGQIESAERSRRAAALRSLQASVTQCKCSKSAAVKDAAWELGVSTTTVGRLLRKFLDDEGRASSIAPGQRGRPKGLSQVSSTVEALIEEHLRLYYLKRERASLARMVAEIRVACKIEGLPPPARQTVQRRLDAMDAREVLRARSGAKVARQKFAAVTGANIAERPLEVVQIDHTYADVILVDSFERKVIGRPWVTLAIDIATRMITGYPLFLNARYIGSRRIGFPCRCGGSVRPDEPDGGHKVPAQVHRERSRSWQTTTPSRSGKEGTISNHVYDPNTAGLVQDGRQFAGFGDRSFSQAHCNYQQSKEQFSSPPLRFGGTFGGTI